jgi:alanine racemase
MTKTNWRSWTEVSLDRIAANYRTVRELVGPEVEVLGVVKSNAYGHGMVEVSRCLVQEGMRWLGVSSVEEGAELRQAGIESRVLVMSDMDPAALEYGLTPVVHSLDDLKAFDEKAQALGQRAAIHVKIDSGMGRLGTRAGADEIRQALQAAPHLEFEGLMSHFASPALFDSPQTEEQLAVFDRMCEALQPKYRHTSSSGAVVYGRQAAWKDLVRVGLALYGYLPTARGAAPAPLLKVTPALEWKARVLLVKELPAGADVGYGALFRTPCPMRIAVVAAGYADGLPHRLSNRGSAVVNGHVVRILGAVSMEVTTVDATECPELNAGDEVTLLGPGFDAQQMADVAGTIPYDVFCKIQGRVRQVHYKGN